jgi:drug/metabolite transporter (DMT)-like permease
VLLLWWATAADRLPAPWSVHAPAAGGSVLLPLLAVLALGVVGTGIAFSLQFDVMRAAGPTVGASVTYVIPVVSVALGVLLLDEHLSWPQLLGAAVVIGAALLIGRPARLRRTARRRG